MKIAIIGSGPQSLEIGALLHELGASLTFFTMGHDDLGLCALVYPEVRSSLFEKYLSLREFLFSEQVVKHENVKRVQKRYLLPSEWPGQRQRLVDLFRVVFESVPKEKLEKQIEENPAFYQELPKEIIAGLHHNIESYDDFDLVIDARERFKSKAMGVGGFALSEELHLNHPQIAYGANVFRKLEAPINANEIALVGSGELALETLLRLTPWLYSKDEHCLFLVTTEENPFQKLSNENSKYAILWQEFAREVDHHFEVKAREFMVKMNEWKELDDFVKVKIPRPVEPIPKVVIFAGHNVMSVDSLIDRQRLFLTLEIPSFRKAEVQVENAQQEMKTIGVDQAFVLTGTYSDIKILKGLNSEEPGLFIFNHRGDFFTDRGQQLFNEECQVLLKFLESLFSRKE